MIKKLFLLLLLWPFLFNQSASAQGELDHADSWTDRFFFGGNIGMQFGSMTLFDISPLVGYRLTNNIAVGVGVTYKYFRYKDFYSITLGGQTRYYDYKANILGGSLFSRYYLTSESYDFMNNIFLHAEYEYLDFSHDAYYLNSLGTDVEVVKENRGISSVFVGGGLRQPLAKKLYLELMVLWNLNESIYSPYENPIIRIGIAAGL